MTQEVVADFQSADEQAGPPRLPPGGIEALGTLAPTPLTEFPKLEDALSRVRANDAAMKNYLLNRFEATLTKALLDGRLPGGDGTRRAGSASVRTGRSHVRKRSRRFAPAPRPHKNPVRRRQAAPQNR